MKLLHTGLLFSILAGLTACEDMPSEEETFDAAPDVPTAAVWSVGGLLDETRQENITCTIGCDDINLEVQADGAIAKRPDLSCTLDVDHEHWDLACRGQYCFSYYGACIIFDESIDVIAVRVPTTDKYVGKTLWNMTAIDVNIPLWCEHDFDVIVQPQ